MSNCKLKGDFNQINTQKYFINVSQTSLLIIILSVECDKLSMIFPVGITPFKAVFSEVFVGVYCLLMCVGIIIVHSGL